MIFNMIAKKQETPITSGFRLVANGISSNMTANTFRNNFGGSVIEFIDYDGVATTITPADCGSNLKKLVTCSSNINLNYSQLPNLEEATFLSATSYINGCVAYCSNLKVARLYTSAAVAPSMFYSCSQLMSLYLYYSGSVVQCGQWHRGTPYEYGGQYFNTNARIYVPANLLAAYKSSRTGGYWYELYRNNSALFATI